LIAAASATHACTLVERVSLLIASLLPQLLCHPFRGEIMPFDFYAILDCCIVSIKRGYREFQVTSLLDEILSQFYVIKVCPCVHNDGPCDASTYLQKVCSILHAERVVEDLTDIQHQLIEITSLTKQSKEQGAVCSYVCS
jgi:hypothetical protein